MRVKGIRARATRAGRGRLRLVVRSDRRLRRSARVLVSVRSGRARTRVELSARGRAIRKTLFAPAGR